MTEDQVNERTLYYWHYKWVAQKHYRALKEIYMRLKENDSQKIESKDLLYDAFYIAGYIFEAVAVYLIFEYVNWKDDESVRLTIKDKNGNFIDSYNDSKHPLAELI